MVDGSKKDQREYHACGVGKKIACLKKGKKLLIYSRSKSQRAEPREGGEGRGRHDI